MTKKIRVIFRVIYPMTKINFVIFCVIYLMKKTLFSLENRVIILLSSLLGVDFNTIFLTIMKNLHSYLYNKKVNKADNRVVRDSSHSSLLLSIYH